MPQNNKYKLLISNTLVFAIGNILVKFIAFFLMPLYTSYLTTKQYGVSELLNSMIEIILPIATLCIIEALYRFSIDKNVDHDVLFMNSIVIVLIGDILVLCGCVIIDTITGYAYIYNFLVLYVTTTFYKMVTQFARGQGHVKRFAAYGVINTLILVGSNVVLIIFFRGGVSAYLNSYSIAFGISGVIAVALSQEYKHLNLNKFDIVTLKSMLKYSVPAIPNMLSWWINNVSNRYFILFFWGAGEAGIYTAASKLPSMINLVTSIFQQAWQYSTATEIGENGEQTFFSNVLRVYTYICTSACVILIFLNKIICSILLKADFYVAWKYVPLLLVAASFGCLSTYFGTFYQALKKNIMLMVSTLIGAVTNIFINLMLMPRMGGVAAAVAMIVSYAVVTIIRMLDIQRRIDIDINWLKISYQMFLLIVYAVFASCLESAISYLLGIIFVFLVISADFNIVLELIKLLKVARKKRKQ